MRKPIAFVPRSYSPSSSATTPTTSAPTLMRLSPSPSKSQRMLVEQLAHAMTDQPNAAPVIKDFIRALLADTDEYERFERTP